MENFKLYASDTEIGEFLAPCLMKQKRLAFYEEEKNFVEIAVVRDGSRYWFRCFFGFPNFDTVRYQIPFIEKPEDVNAENLRKSCHALLKQYQQECQPRYINGKKICYHIRMVTSFFSKAAVHQISKVKILEVKALDTIPEQKEVSTSQDGSCVIVTDMWLDTVTDVKALMMQAAKHDGRHTHEVHDSETILSALNFIFGESTEKFPETVQGNDLSPMFEEVKNTLETGDTEGIHFSVSYLEDEEKAKLEQQIDKIVNQPIQNTEKE